MGMGWLNRFIFRRQQNRSFSEFIFPSLSPSITFSFFLLVENTPRKASRWTTDSGRRPGSAVFFSRKVGRPIISYSFIASLLIPVAPVLALFPESISQRPTSAAVTSISAERGRRRQSGGSGPIWTKAEPEPASRSSSAYKPSGIRVREREGAACIAWPRHPTDRISPHLLGNAKI